MKDNYLWAIQQFKTASRIYHHIIVINSKQALMNVPKKTPSTLNIYCLWYISKEKLLPMLLELLGRQQNQDYKKKLYFLIFDALIKFATLDTFKSLISTKADEFLNPKIVAYIGK